MKTERQDQEIVFIVTLTQEEIAGLATDYSAICKLREIAQSPGILLQERMPIVSQTTTHLIGSLVNI